MKKRILFLSIVLILGIVYFIVYALAANIPNIYEGLTAPTNGYLPGEKPGMWLYFKEQFNVFVYLGYIPELSMVAVPIISILGAVWYRERVNTENYFRIGKTNDFMKKLGILKIVESIKIALVNTAPVLITVFLLYLFNPTLDLPESSTFYSLNEYMSVGLIKIFSIKIIFLFYIIFVNYFIYSFICSLFCCVLTDYIRNMLIVSAIMVGVVYVIPLVMSNVDFVDRIYLLFSGGMTDRNSFIGGPLILNIIKPYLLLLVIAIVLRVSKDYEV